MKRFFALVATVVVVGSFIGPVNETFAAGEGSRTPCSALLQAAKACDQRALENQFERGCASEDVRDERGFTPIHLALESGCSEELIASLLEHGANLSDDRNVEHLTPVSSAGYLASPSVFSRILNAVSDDVLLSEDRYGSTLLRMTVMSGDPQKLNILRKRIPLLRFGNDEVNYCLGFIVAAKDLMESRNLRPPNIARRHRHPLLLLNMRRVAEILLQEGADPNAPWTTGDGGVIFPLDIAIISDDVELSELLLKYGADPTAMGRVAGMAKGSKVSPLALAANTCSLDCVRLLLETGKLSRKVLRQAKRYVSPACRKEYVTLIHQYGY